MAIEVELPTLHADQVKAFKMPGRFKAIRCGRRWGKTAYGTTLACDGAIKRQEIGFFAPDYKRLTETYHEISGILRPVKQAASRIDGVYRTITGGRIDFWTLEDENAGRSRKYHKVIVDEAAFTKPNMMEIWERSILPTLFDYQGTATVLSNTKGIDPTNFFYAICNEPKYGFKEYHAPTHANPLIPARLPEETEDAFQARRAAIFEKLQADNHPLVYQQEYLAEFVDWSGTAFFDREKLLVEGQPVPVPQKCDGVFAVIDTAVKTGKDNDGTGVIYFAVSKHLGHPLIILDWDIEQIEGASLEIWLPSVFQKLEALSKECGARMGSLGAWIEDKVSGTVLLQQARRRNLPVSAIDSKLTAMGKDERAISVSGYVYRGMVKIAQSAFDKTTTYKGTTRNHLMAQVLGFRIGDKDATRQDDLLDGFAYGVSIALGNSAGY